MISQRSTIVRSARTLALAAGLATLSGTSLAQTANIRFEVTTTPEIAGSWGPTAERVPGQTYYFRMWVRLVGATALGLAGLTCSPTLSGWNAAGGDVRMPFTFPGLDNRVPATPQTEVGYVGRHVDPNVPTNTGRMYPFGAGGMRPTSASGVLVSHNDPGGTLRFGGHRATTATTNVAWGMAITQLPPEMNGTSFNSSLDVVVFRYAVALSASDLSERQLRTDASNFTLTRTAWWLNADGTEGLHVPIGTITNAAIVPGPGAAGLMLAVLGFAGARRRR